VTPAPSSAAGGRWRRHPWGIRGLVLLVVLVAGCRTQVDVNIDLARDGSGTVEIVVGLDADALSKIGGDFTSVLDSASLTAAGWSIDGPARESDGYTRVHLRHPFADPAEAAGIFEQIAGDTGPFQHFRVSRDPAFLETRWRFTGSVDFSGGLAGLGDDGVAPTVDGEPLGQTVSEIEAQLGQSLSRLLQVRIRARLPGDVTSNATTKADNGAVWQVGFGQGAVEMEATGAERRTSALVLAGAGIALGLVLLVVLLVRLAMRRTATDRAVS
jgi:hypothetical protein